ncbi:MAG: hypothetical protein M1832_001300 [Thelocarpon impressellum]|nr:MAG: hypothetical protein M1832_001300 [Thelocarpon impressellum]
MQIRNILSLAVFGLVSTAAAVATGPQKRDDDHCLTKTQAADIVSRFTSLAINVQQSVADVTVTNDFQFFSDNQDFLEGRIATPGSLTGIPSVKNKTDLVQQQQGAQAPGTPVIPQSFTIFQIIHSCSAITFRWRFHAIAGTIPGSTTQPGDPIEYAGIDVLIVEKTAQHLVKKAYSEWNSGELLYDLGLRTCFQKGNPSACT